MGGKRKMNVAIVDDIPADIDEVTNLLERFSADENLTVTSFFSVEAYKDAVLGGRQFDVLFLDILLGNENGIELASSLIEMTPHITLVFISVNPFFFRDVYKVQHAYFLTKPIDSVYFEDCMRHIAARYAAHKLVLGKNGVKEIVVLSRVRYLESILHKTVFHFCDDTSLSVSQKMEEIYKKILSPAFVRVHKSFIINLDHVSHIERSKVYFDEKNFVNVSRPFVGLLREKTAEYFNEIL